MIYWRYKRLTHDQPISIEADSCYFITICGKPKGFNQFCHPDIGQTFLQSVGHYHGKGNWFCDLAVLMPDHIHLVLHFPPNKSLAKVIGLWKRWLAREHSIVWQPDSRPASTVYKKDSSQA